MAGQELDLQNDPMLDLVVLKSQIIAQIMTGELSVVEKNQLCQESRTITSRMLDLLKR